MFLVSSSLRYYCRVKWKMKELKCYTRISNEIKKIATWLFLKKNNLKIWITKLEDLIDRLRAVAQNVGIFFKSKLDGENPQMKHQQSKICERHAYLSTRKKERLRRNYVKSAFLISTFLKLFLENVSWECFSWIQLVNVS